MPSPLAATLSSFGQHLESDRQAWLLGSGVSFNAGIPSMYPLTARVNTLLATECPAEAPLFELIRSELPTDHHIEHVLSQIGDYIALAERSKHKSVALSDSNTYTAATLRKLHADTLDRIGHVVRYGYKAAAGAIAEQIGTPAAPIVKVDDHRSFVRAVFAARSRPGLGQAPTAFFTTNYDSLVEDALALERIPYVDGFVGGAIAFWAPEQTYIGPRGAKPARPVRAQVFKLHGSVDWHLGPDGEVFRCRETCAYPDKSGNLLIYPQSTKYVATQKDPFAAVFSWFRSALDTLPDNVLGVCGYSFSDEHVDGEIEAAMSRSANKTVLIAFVREKEVPGGSGTTTLPDRLSKWLSDETPWRERLFVATDRGLYHGSATNLFPPASGATHPWWTFQGLTQLLIDGPPSAPS